MSSSKKVRTLRRKIVNGPQGNGKLGVDWGGKMRRRKFIDPVEVMATKYVDRHGKKGQQKFRKMVEGEGRSTEEIMLQVILSQPNPDCWIGNEIVAYRKGVSVCRVLKKNSSYWELWTVPVERLVSASLILLERKEKKQCETQRWK